VRLKERLVTKVSMKKLVLYAVILVPVNLNVGMKRNVTFPFSVTQQGFPRPQSARPKTELEYFQLFFSDDLSGEIVTAGAGAGEYAVGI
jgi:hypothetical protein